MPKLKLRVAPVSRAVATVGEPDIIERARFKWKLWRNERARQRKKEELKRGN